MDVIGRIKQIERVSDKKIDEWQSNVALLTVNVHINMLKAKYKRNTGTFFSTSFFTFVKN